ncbi:TPA: hypothetical protein HA265_01230 [Candidatus Woesearchaeota archaeon]|nr:hypothetical protein [Candidatus Woesearchaeota archaeon]
MSSEVTLKALSRIKTVSPSYSGVRGALCLLGSVVTAGFAVRMGYAVPDVGQDLSTPMRYLAQGGMAVFAGTLLFAAGSLVRSGVSSFVRNPDFVVYDEGAYISNPSVYDVENAEIVTPVDSLPSDLEGLLFMSPVEAEPLGIDIRTPGKLPHEPDYVDDRKVYEATLTMRLNGSEFTAVYRTFDKDAAESLSGRIYALADFDQNPPELIDWGPVHER